MSGGRPKKKIDYELGIIVKAAKIGLTEHQIAFLLNVTNEYIQKYYSQIIEDNLPVDYMKRRMKRYYKAHPQARIIDKYKGKRINWYKKKRKDPCFCISCSIRGQMVYHIRRQGVVKTQKTFNALAYSVDDLMRHLEMQFIDGMNWDNYGDWHIDHIRPASWFKYQTTSDQEFKDCWALSNLQPLWAKDNIRKGNKWEG